ncbi:MAG: fumarylacetoacetase [Phycisphaerales bacterium]
MTDQPNDPTLDPARVSWVESASGNNSDFPIQNLPLGVFSQSAAQADALPHIGIAIGELVLDAQEAEKAGLLDALSPTVRCATHSHTLNDLMKLGRPAWIELRDAVSTLLDSSNDTLQNDTSLRRRVLIPQSDVRMHLPAEIGDYTDFYASVHHATNIGSMFRPDNPLLPNYKHLPVGYHGRASSIVVSGNEVVRPSGQTIPNDDEVPVFAPSRLLDYEMEMGVFTGPGNPRGTRVPMQSIFDHLFGMVIVNDWSARDVQKWEYQPLGPFNAKNFATTISPWVVTFEALAPFRLPGPPRGRDDPATLEYLRPTASSSNMTLDITVEVWLRSDTMRKRNMSAIRISSGNLKHMYWTVAQMLAHHTSTGCNMRPGDLLASGTISGPEPESRGCLLERTWRGTEPISLPDGSERKFLQDGDEVIMRAFCERDGFHRIGFGECSGIIRPAYS